jgi:hypothetical protein
MEGPKQTRISSLIMVALGALALFALVLALGTPQAGAASYVSGKAGIAAPAHESETPQATETQHPEGTRTPEATRTEDPHESETPEATETHHPEGTRTPEATRTEDPHESETPEATETHHPEGTRTPESSHTPEGTRTPESSHTPEGTHTPRPIPTRVLTLDPRVQFREVQPGQTYNFDLRLRNRANTAADVTLDATSLQGWTVSVVPASAHMDPDSDLAVALAVGVPQRPSSSLDVVSLVATDGTNTASAFVVLLTEQRAFHDLTAQDWAWQPVQYLASQNVISGYADGSFRPNNPVTRAQFAKMLVNGMGWAVVSPAQATFRDVPSTYWAFGYVETAVQHGALTGYADGSFRPDSNITRAQLAKLIVTARGWALVQPGTATFSDVPADFWASGFVETAVDAQILTGYNDGSFRPNAPATRAQVAKILSNGLVLNQDR